MPYSTGRTGMLRGSDTWGTAGRSVGRGLATYRRLVQVDHRLRVEPEVLGVRAQEAASVDGRRQRGEVFGFERLEVAATDARIARRVGERHTFVEARLAQRLTQSPHV